MQKKIMSKIQGRFQLVMVMKHFSAVLESLLLAVRLQI